MMFLQLNLTRVIKTLTWLNPNPKLFVSRLLDYDVLKNEKWEKITMQRLKGDWARNDNWVARLSPLGIFFFIYRQLELEGKVQEAAMLYMDALELMDSDYSVHVKVLELAEQMNFQPPLIETA